LKDIGGVYQGYYYPAASYCYSYTPNVADGEEMNDMFGVHKWYLPTYAEMARVWYCQYKDLFDKASNEKAHNFFKKLGGEYWTSTENSINSAWMCNFGDEYMWTLGNDKNTTLLKVRPVAKF
jgi:hypothetical protein